MFKSNFLNEISTRGFIYQSSDIEDLDTLMNQKAITAYIGFDITSDSLHIGSLLQLMLLHWLDYYDHKTIALIGGGTTLIGDPSGKDEGRKILQLQDIENNIVKIEKIFEKFINLKDKAKIINNYEWLSDINYINFLRDVGSRVTINKMLTFESVKNRLDREQPLTFLEFNYMLLQAYDYYHLNKEYDCELQLGGSDQWGNIVSGIDLIRRLNNKKTFAITSPLITNNDGSKMGKTADGAIWLDECKLSNYDFYQFWRNADDTDVPKFLHFFTKLPLEEISKLSKLKGQEINEAKKILVKTNSAEYKSEKLTEIALVTVDIKGVGLYTLGPYRKDLTEEQKKEYANLFKKYFLKTFVSRLTDYSEPKIDVISAEKKNEKYTIVSSILLATDKKPEVKIDWRVYTKNPNKPLIRDLIIEGLSLARTQKEEFSSIIESNDGDINALFNKLREFINS